MVTNRARQEIIWIAPNEKIPIFAQTTGNVDFLIRVQAFCDPLRGEHRHIQIFMRDGPNPLTEMPSSSAIDLGEIRPAVFQD